MSYNKAIIIGRTTKDIELKQTQSGKSVCSFSVAVDRRYDRDKTDFLNIVAWGKTAEFVQQYFHKGDQICIDGRVETRSYEDKNGSKRTAVEIIAETVFFVGGKTNTAGGENAAQGDLGGFSEVDEGGEDLPF